MAKYKIFSHIFFKNIFDLLKQNNNTVLWSLRYVEVKYNKQTKNQWNKTKK